MKKAIPTAKKLILKLEEFKSMIDLSAKHRYVYFCTSDKKLKKQWKEALNYPILPYPKGDNENYELGRVYSQVLIDKDKNIIHRENEYVMKITT